MRNSRIDKNGERERRDGKRKKGFFSAFLGGGVREQWVHCRRAEAEQ